LDVNKGSARPDALKTTSSYERCPVWLDLFLRAARVFDVNGWLYKPAPCWACGQSGQVVEIYLHPLGRAYSAELCAECHSLRVSFCDEDLMPLDWDTLLAYAPPGLYTVECHGDSGWPATNDAVAGLRRAVEEAERAEAAGWRKQPALTVVRGSSISR
jgi:hypothetical protein